MSVWAGISVFETRLLPVWCGARLDGPDRFRQAKTLVRRLNIEHIVCVETSDQCAEHHGSAGRSAGAIALKAE
jgi:hypothetical protein